MIQTEYGKFLFGAFGGILPTLAGLASFYVKSPNPDLPTLGLLLGLVIYAVVGGGVAVGFVTSQEVKQAITTGIAAPALIASIVAGHPDKAEKQAQEGWLINTAYAEEVSAPAAGSEKNIVLFDPIVIGQLPNGNVEVYAVTDGNAPTPVASITNFSGTTAIELPQGVSAIKVGDNEIPLNKEITRIDLSVQSMPTIKNDLWWALGAKREYGIQSVDIKEQK